LVARDNRKEDAIEEVVEERIPKTHLGDGKRKKKCITYGRYIISLFIGRLK